MKLSSHFLLYANISSCVCLLNMVTEDFLTNPNDVHTTVKNNDRGNSARLSYLPSKSIAFKQNPLVFF